MELASLQIAPYKRKFRRPFISGAHSWSERTGWLLRGKKNATAGWRYAEAAPLEGFSSSSVTEVGEWLRGRPPKAWSSTAAPASIRFALSCLMDPPLPDFHAKTSALVDASWTEAAELRSRLRRLLDTGARTIKLKLSEKNAEAMAAVLREPWNAKFRLDANAALEASRAVALLKSFTGLSVDYCEDPCEPADPALWAEIQKESGLPLAVDQPLGVSGGLAAWLRAGIQHFVLKPSTLGSRSEIALMVVGIRAAGGSFVLSTALETEVGIAAASSLARELGAESEEHGLSTAEFFVAPEAGWLDALDWQERERA